MDVKQVPAGDFKQRCLALIDDVAHGSYEIVITKRGKPMARLVPVESDHERENSILAWLRGTGRILVSEEEFIQPTTEDLDWEALGEGFS